MPYIVVGYLAFVLLFIAGWIMNLMEVLHSSVITVGIAVRLIGIFIFPLGCILGYF